MKTQRIEGHESELVRMLKKQGFVAVKRLSIYDLSEELANLAVEVAREELYRAIKIVPTEAVLKEGYSFSGQTSHVVYAIPLRKKRAYVVMGQVKNPAGSVDVRPL